MGPRSITGPWEICRDRSLSHSTGVPGGTRVAPGLAGAQWASGEGTLASTFLLCPLLEGEEEAHGGTTTRSLQAVSLAGSVASVPGALPV